MKNPRERRAPPPEVPRPPARRSFAPRFLALPLQPLLLLLLQLLLLFLLFLLPRPLPPPLLAHRCAEFKYDSSTF